MFPSAVFPSALVPLYEPLVSTYGSSGARNNFLWAGPLFITVVWMFFVVALLVQPWAEIGRGPRRA